MNRIGLDEVHIAVQACPGVPTALLRFVLQIDIDIHAVAGDQIRQDIAVEGVIPVRPIAYFFAIHIHVRMRHGTIDNKGVEAFFVNGYAGMIMSFAHPRESTATTGFPCRFAFAVLPYDDLLQVVRTVKRSADRPIMRNGYLLPNGVLRRILRELPLAQQSIRTNGLLG